MLSTIVVNESGYVTLFSSDPNLSSVSVILVTDFIANVQQHWNLINKKISKNAVPTIRRELDKLKKKSVERYRSNENLYMVAIRRLGAG